MKKFFDSDLLGITASVICLIHCLAMPWIIAISGAWLGSYFTSPWFHHVMLGVALLIGIPIFLQSFLKYRSYLILFTGVAGLSLTAFGTLKTGDTCCPPPAMAEVSPTEEEEEGGCSSCEGCDSHSEVETEKAEDGTVKVETESVKTEVENAEAEIEAVKLLPELSDEKGGCETDCGTCEEEPEHEITEAGFNFVPLGVFLLIVAHSMNFAHRKKCKKPCCPSE